MKERLKQKKWLNILGYSIPLIVAILSSIFNWGPELQAQSGSLFHDILIWIGAVISGVGVAKSHDQTKDTAA